MIHLVKKFFREFDMFSSYATLRTKGEPQTRNTCAGVLSFVILLLFIYLFISQFISVTNWEKIQSIETQNNTFDANRTVSNFMVGVGLQGFRIEGISEYLRFQMIEVTKTGSKETLRRTLRTEKCTRAHWPQLKNSIEQNFNSFDLQKKLCLALDEQFEVHQPSNGVYKVLLIEVNACRRQYYSNKSFMYDDCANENMTEYKNNLQIEAHKYFTASVVYINTAFNPLIQKPTTKFMESVRLTFTIDQGTEAFVNFLTYSIETDNSILPYQQVSLEQGHATHVQQHNNFQIVKYFEHASCTFLLSSTSIVIDRRIGKIDQILSYSGGLFGIIISFLAFFMNSFNEYRYELRTAQSAFNYNEDGKKVKERDFTFFLYLKYQVFDWVKTLTCVQIPWQDCQQIDQTRQQAISQLDMTLMFKKLQFFERFIEHVISDKEKIGLFLTQPPSIQKVKVKRMVAQYYEKVIKGRPAVTIQDLNTTIGKFEYACDELKVRDQQNSRSSINDQIMYERGDIIEYAIDKYNELRLECEADDDVFFNEEQSKIEKHIAFSFFMIPEPSRKKIQRKIPIKILKRLYRIKMNQVPSSVGSINLEI